MKTIWSDLQGFGYYPTMGKLPGREAQLEGTEGWAALKHRSWLQGYASQALSSETWSSGSEVFWSFKKQIPIEKKNSDGLKNNIF